MSDTYLEYLVPKRSTPKDTLLKVLMVIAGIVVALVVFSLSPLLGPLSMFGWLASFGALFGAYKLVTMMNVEFEYILTNGDLDVDKIVNRNSRKRLVSVKCTSFETFGKYKEIDHKNKNYQTRLMLCSSPLDDGLWYASFRHSKLGHTLLVFNASEKMLSELKPFIPKQLAFEAFVRKTAE